MKRFWLGFVAGIAFSFLAMMGIGYFLAQKLDRANEDLPKPALIQSKTEKVSNLSMKLYDTRTDTPITGESFTNKIVFLNFWEYWCVPCKQELPAIERLYNSVTDSSVVFAIISTQKPEIVKKDKVLQEIKLPFYYVNGVLPDVLKGEAVPRTFIIAKNGEIVVKEIGASAWDDEKVVRLIDSLKSIP